MEQLDERWPIERRRRPRAAQIAALAAVVTSVMAVVMKVTQA